MFLQYFDKLICLHSKRDVLTSNYTMSKGLTKKSKHIKNKIEKKFLLFVGGD